MVYKIDLQDGIERAKVTRRKSFPSKYHEEKYLDHCIVIHDTVYFFYDWENIAIMDAMNLITIKELKLYDSLCKDGCLCFGLITDTISQKVSLFANKDSVASIEVGPHDCGGCTREIDFRI